MARKNNERIETFRNEGVDFITNHFKDMEDAFSEYMKEKNYDKAVSLYFKLADKVIPSMPTQALNKNTEEQPEWAAKVERMKKTIENDTK